MTINDGYKFVYDNTSSEKFGIILCDIGSANTDSNDEETQLITSTTPYKDTWDLHDVQKSAPLQFRITICKSDGTFIDAFEEETLKEWLCIGEYSILQIEQDDLYDTYYKCIINNPQKISVDRYNGGMQFTVTCNSGMACTEMKRKIYTSTGTLTFNFINNAKYKKYTLYPTLIITPTANGTISIKNNTTNQTVSINNCVTTEIITLDCKNDMAESTSGRILVDDWNIEYLELIKGSNNITLTGQFVLKMEFRLPVRNGG
jgi:phage-related protein